MKTNTILIAILFIGAFFGSTASAQGVFDQLKKKAESKVQQTTTNSAAAYPHWARFEVRLSRKENGEWKYKTRVYYTNIIDLSAEDSQNRDMKTELIEYFNAAVVKPLENEGFQVGYYTSDVELYPRSTPYTARKEAEDHVKERIEVDRSNEREIYTFTWKYGANGADALKTAQPKKWEGK